MKNLLLFLGALLIGLLASETAMRIAGFHPRAVNINRFFIPGTETTWSVPDPELGWINKPGVSRSIEEGEAPMTFWDFSRRASRPDPAPRDGIPVMIIGGSNAQSYGVRDEDSFVSLLAQREPDFWLENFGTGGYGTVQAMMLAERAYHGFYGPRKPRLILLAFDDSHMARNVADQSWIFSISDPEGRYVAPPHYRIKDGALVFHPFRTIGFWPLENVSAGITVLHNVWLQSFAYNTANQALPVTRAVIDRLAAFAKSNNALFAVTVLEDRSGVTRTLLSDQPFPVLDCSGPGRSDPKQFLLGGNSHPNAKLHAYFAQCIGDWFDKTLRPQLEAAP
jgi:hypothetical protein